MPETTDSLYRPPAARIADEGLVAGQDGTGTFVVGVCVQQAWEATTRNVGAMFSVVAFLVLATLVLVVLFGLVSTLSMGLALFVGVGSYLLAVPVLGWGFVRFSLNAIDGRASAVDLLNIFERFGVRLVRLIAAWLAILIVSLPGSIPQVLTQSSDRVEIVLLGGLWSWLWSFGIPLRLTLAFYFLVDRDLPALDALRRSWEWTRGNWLKLIGLTMVDFGLMLAGVLALGVGVFVAAPVAALTYPSAYRQIVGRVGPATAVPGA